MTELIHSRRSPFIHTSRYVGGRRKLGCLPREQQPIAANRFKALAAAAAAGAADEAGAAANWQSLQSTSSSSGSRGSSSSRSRSGGSSRFAFGKCPSPSWATRRRQPAIRHFACGEWRMLAGGAVAVASPLEYGPKRSGRSASRAPPPVGLENAPAPPPGTRRKKAAEGAGAADAFCRRPAAAAGASSGCLFSSSSYSAAAAAAAAAANS